MPMIRRFSIALLAVVLMALGASAASAGPLVGYLSATDHRSFGLTITVVNESDVETELAGGDSFYCLIVDLLDALGTSLATYSRPELGVGEEWASPEFDDSPIPRFLDVARVELSLFFRGAKLESSLQTCVEGLDGCFVDTFESIATGEVCFGPDEECELTGRTAGAGIEYEPAVTAVPDGGIPMGETLTSLLASVTALRYMRVRRRREPAPTTHA